MSGKIFSQGRPSILLFEERRKTGRNTRTFHEALLDHTVLRRNLLLGMYRTERADAGRSGLSRGRNAPIIVT